MTDRLLDGVVEGFAITALSQDSASTGQVEIVAALRSGAELCVNGSQAKTVRRRKGDEGVIEGIVSRGQTLVVHACGTALPNTTAFLPAEATANFNHYGYKP